MRFMRFMDISRYKLLAVVILAITLSYGCGRKTAEIDNSNLLVDKAVEARSENADETDFDTEDIYVINNTVEQIINNIDTVDNGGKVGRYDGQEIYVFKYPKLTTKSIIYSNEEIPVVYDDYLCVKYKPEKDNEQYILLVYYFNADDMWESWYKYIVAISEKEASVIAGKEKENGYAVWADGNIVVVGEQFSDINTSKKDFIRQFENAVNLEK